MTNAEWVIQLGCSFTQISVQDEKQKKGGGFRIAAEKNGSRVVIGRAPKIYDGLNTTSAERYQALLRWLDEEHVEPLLTEDERDFLSMVISPIRNYVTEIFVSNEHILRIFWKDTVAREPGILHDIAYPAYNHCKGMVPGKSYTVEELGL